MKTVCIVGVSHGIGRATAEQFISLGYSVIGVDREETSLEHASYTHHIVDPGVREQITNLVTMLNDVEITDLVYGVADQHIFSSLEPNLTLLERMITTNVASAWYLASLLQKQKPLSSIVCISSVHALATSASIAGYALTKAALSSLVRSLAIDFAPQGTRVNGVIPGAIRTRMLTDHLNEDQLKKLSSRQLLPHIGEPSEIANVISFLVSEKASFITGQRIVADGECLHFLQPKSYSTVNID